MTRILPQSTDYLNSGPHDFLHRVVSIDTGSPEQSIDIDSSGYIHIGNTTTSTPNARLKVSHSDAGLSFSTSQNMGVFGEAVGSGSSSGRGMYGVGYASGTLQGYGGYFLGKVLLVADTASVWGTVGVATDVHSGVNVGVLGQATGGTSNKGGDFSASTYGSGFGYAVVGTSSVSASADTATSTGGNFSSVTVHAGGDNTGAKTSASGSSTNNYGTQAYGTTYGTGNAYAVQAYALVNASADTGGAYALYGTSNSTHSGGQNIGVVGIAAGSGTVNKGVSGQGNTNSTIAGMGVYGLAQAGATGDTAYAYGTYGQATTTHAGGPNVGAYGVASGSAYENMGVYGNATAVTGQSFISMGVWGVGATAGTGSCAGGYFQVNIGATGDSGSAYGVEGISTGTHEGGTNYGGYFNASGGATNYAIYCTGSIGYFASNLGVASYIQMGATTNIFYDGSAHYLLSLTKSSVSAANYLDIANSISGSDVIVSALGSDTDLSLQLKAKGAGQVKITTGVFLPVQAVTGSAPAYVKGGMYFDTTLNKLRIGGATVWETVTSV